MEKSLSPTSTAPLESTEQKSRMTLVKKNDPRRFLNFTIGRLRVETWGYRDPKKEPYARLIICNSCERRKASMQKTQPQGHVLETVLDSYHASVFAFALSQWVASLTDGPRTTKSPALSAQIANIHLKLSGLGTPGMGPHAELTLTDDEGGPTARATLTHLEAGMLAGALDSIVPDEIHEG